MHAISSYRGNRPTHTHTNTYARPPTNHRQDRLQYTVNINSDYLETVFKSLTLEGQYMYMYLRSELVSFFDTLHRYL